MSLTLYIARHGEDTFNKENRLNGHTDTELTSHGVEQAHNLGLQIKNSNKKITKIFTSPLKRAQNTAIIVSNYTTNQPPIILNELIERDYGNLSGKLVTDIPLLCDQILWVGKNNYPISGNGLNLEPLQSVESRAIQALKLIQTENKEGSILIICHREIGKVLWCVANNYTWTEGLPHAPSLHNTDTLEVILNHD